MKSFSFSYLNLHTTTILVIFLILGGLMWMSCTTSKTTDENRDWVGTWSTAQQLTEPRNMPPEPGLSGNTIRQIARVSVGGEKLRFRISNAFGTEPVSVTSIHIAHSKGESHIDPESDLALTFGDTASVFLEAGASALSDPFDFELEPSSNVAITMHIESIGEEVTGHPGSRTTSYIVTGNRVSDSLFTEAATTNHWYLMDAIDVMAPAHYAAIVTLGNSITDGRGSGTNKQNRWPDELSRRLLKNDGTNHIAVLNQGIGGNCVLKPCLGPAAVDRFERDVLNQTGVKWLIILEGINDIGGIRNAEQAEEVVNGLKEAYTEMAEKAHQAGIKVYMATLMPFGESFYDGPVREEARQAINHWIRDSETFDAVIDLDKALADPKNPTQLLPKADTGDHLHPNETGHRLIAEAIDLSLFYKAE